MLVGIAADHGGFELKKHLIENLKSAHYEIRDFGAYDLEPDDDYPDFVVPLAAAIASGDVDRGIAVCGSGVGACIAANKIRGVRASLIHESYSAQQGVEDDNMNMICLGGKVIGSVFAWHLVQTFLKTNYKDEPRFQRRLAEVAELERETKSQ